MAGKARKDSRGYALRTGECQRSDGRYSYGYTDRTGKRHTVYAKSLVELRNKEKNLQKQLLMEWIPSLLKSGLLMICMTDT